MEEGKRREKASCMAKGRIGGRPAAGKGGWFRCVNFPLFPSERPRTRPLLFFDLGLSLPCMASGEGGKGGEARRGGERKKGRRKAFWPNQLADNANQIVQGKAKVMARRYYCRRAMGIAASMLWRKEEGQSGISMPRPFSSVEWSRSRIVPIGRLLFPAGIKRVLHAFASSFPWSVLPSYPEGLRIVSIRNILPAIEE